MALEKKAFIEGYLAELRENIQHIDNGILALKKDPGNEDELSTLLRVLHTIKGSSRMLKFSTIEKIVHGLENVFKGVRDERYGITNELIQLVFITTDYIRHGAKNIQHTTDDTFDVQKLLDVFDKAYANEPYSLKGIKIEDIIPKEEEQDSQQTDAQDDSGASTSSESSKSSASSSSKALTQEKSSSQVSSRSQSTLDDYQSIRVDLDTVEEIIKTMNELFIKQFQLKRDYELINEFEKNYSDFYILGNTKKKEVNQSDIETENQLYKQLQQIRKSLQEQITLIERNTFELQEKLFGLRMLPLELILGSLPKLLEESAIQLGKEVDFSIYGKDQKMDKVILEKISDPIIHIVRNAIDHGLETPEEREKSGKPRMGRLEIRCFSEGGNINIEIEDDGRGIDFERIRAKAIESNPNQEDEIRNMSDDELSTFLFQTGFSTKSDVTDLSGRGVGLDIVRYNIEKIKGKITLKSQKNKGSIFRLSLPLSLATVEGYFVVASGKKFFIPSNFVSEIIILKSDSIIDLPNSRVFRLRDKIIPLYELSNLIEGEGSPLREKLNVVVAQSMGEQIGIHVDSVLEFTSLIYKPLPKNMLSLTAIQGIVFDETFSIVNILYIPEILNRFKGLRMIDIKKRYLKDQKSGKSILVVDDSLNTREIEKSILELEDYNVITAVDGIDGLEKANKYDIDLIISDVNMPRMDGFTMIENIKREERFKRIPIVVISSFEQADYKKKIKQLGINAYIIKSDFDRNNLLEVVSSLISG